MAGRITLSIFATLHFLAVLSTGAAGKVNRDGDAKGPQAPQRHHAGVTGLFGTLAFFGIKGWSYVKPRAD
jgi:hypothetical protein